MYVRAGGVHPPMDNLSVIVPGRVHTACAGVSARCDRVTGGNDENWVVWGDV